MTEIMLRDAGTAHRLPHMILRYFNVAGANPLGRTGESPRGATHLIKVRVKTALGRRPKMEIFGTDYPTPDGTCIRDYIHVSMPLGPDLTSAGRRAHHCQNLQDLCVCRLREMRTISEVDCNVHCK
jgi:UDP-glucose 4-epimerase